MQRANLTDAGAAELSVTEALQIMRALDSILLDNENSDLSPLKDTSKYSDAMMITFILCSMLSILYIRFQGLKALADLIIYFITNIFWNGVDVTALMDNVKDFFAHQDSESRRAAIAGVGSVGVMIGATLWSLIEVGLSGWQLPTKANIAAGGAVVGVGFVAGMFSFSFTMFASAYQSQIAMKQAEKRSTRRGLLKYKQEKLKEKQSEKEKLETLIQAQTNTSPRDSCSSQTPLLTQNKNSTKLNEKCNEINAEIKKLNTEISMITRVKSHCKKKNTSGKKAKITPSDVLTVDLMLAEQRNIRAAKQLDMWSQRFAGVGSGLVAASFFFWPLLAPGLFFCGVAALIKGYQLTEKYLLTSTVNQTSSNEREQVFLATAKELKKQSSSSEITVDLVQSELLRKYCKRRKLSPDAFNNDINQKRTAVDLECKYRYAKKGALDRLHGRVTIASTRFCGLFSPRYQDNASPASTVASVIIPLN